MIVPVMAISNLVLTRQSYSEEINGAHAHYREPVPSGNNLFLKDHILNIYAHTAKIQGTFRVNHIAKDRAACCQYFLVKYNYGSES